MFDDGAMLGASGLDALASTLRRIREDVDDAERIDQLAALERLKAAASAARVRVTAAFVESQGRIAEQWRDRAREFSEQHDFEGWRAAREQARRASVAPPEPSAGVRARRAQARSGVEAQVALARRVSPSRGARHVGMALTLTRDMPHTFAALESGELSEWRAELVVREAAVLSADLRRELDDAVCGRGDVGRDRVGSLGDRELCRRVRAVAYRLDPASVVARARRAESARRVSIRPAPDTMAYLTALLPVAQAVAAHASLVAAADTARVSGDDRSKGQVMCDALVTRLTGQASADAVPVEIQLVMTDRTLLASDDTPAQVPCYGSVPARWARSLVQGGDSTDAEARAVWVRRLYTHPVDGSLVALDSTRRTFTGGLRRFVLARDAGTCRTPWCDAPARHVDHVEEHAGGGPTSVDNAQGLCVRCNHTKQLPRWSARSVVPPPGAGSHVVLTTTPTGHTYASHAPPLLPGLPYAPSSAFEGYLDSLTAA